MWIDDPIVRADMDYILSVPFIDWDAFRNKRFFITGATGLIGSSIVNALVYANKELSLGLEINALVRNESRASTYFADQLKYGCLTLILGSVESFPDIDKHFDYIIHGASPTSSRFFAENPVETMQTAILGTINILEHAKKSIPSGVVYLSSMEVYGAPATDDKIHEGYYCNLDLSSPRSSYPESKRACESFCVAYAAEYGVPVRILRLTQTFGPGVKYDDSRVFAEFARCVIEDKDIVLATKGETKRSYLYTADAVTAILVLLQKGEAGEAYNAANESTYCSILEMAEMVSAEFGRNTSVVIDETAAKGRGFAPVLHMNLDTRKLIRLGWKPDYALNKMFVALIQSMSKGLSINLCK